MRTDGGQRRYTVENIAVIEEIKKLRNEGMSLPEIKRKLGKGQMPKAGSQRSGDKRMDRIDLLADRVTEVVKAEVTRFFEGVEALFLDSIRRNEGFIRVMQFGSNVPQSLLDRVERDKNRTIWVIDYKTGSKVKMPKNTTSALDREAIRHGIVSFQLPLYLLLCNRQYGLGSRWAEMNAALYGLRYLTDSSNLGALQHVLFLDEDRPAEIVNGCYAPALKALINEILDPVIPFTPDLSDLSYCRSCPYCRHLCRGG